MLTQVQPGRGCLAALSDGGARLVRQALKDEQDRRGWWCPGRGGGSGAVTPASWPETRDKKHEGLASH